MKVFKSAYDFYALAEVERKKLVGQCFKEKDRNHLFFPLQLTKDEFNYGIQEGLIFVSPIIKYKAEKWFRVGVFSPDDLDLDLDFSKPVGCIRQDVIEFVRKMNKRNVTYRGVLEAIQKHFQAGEITS